MSTTSNIIRSAVSKLRCYGRANCNYTETVLTRLQHQQRPRYNSSCCLAAHDKLLPTTVLPYRHFGTSNGGLRKESESGSETTSGGQRGNNGSTTTATASNNNDESNATERKKEDDDESHLNWKDRKEAPKWMTRIAPTKGGKWPPSPQEAAILVSGLAVFVYSWTA